ncbi:MAG: hypothetical protein KKC77_19090 [Proteobacteria bacterium]|nr:hypothetical protein [Pseudomonadota bacterium]
MSISFSITVDTKELERIVAQVEPVSNEIIVRLATETEVYAKSYSPVDTGALMNSIHHFSMGNAWQRIKPEVHYAIYQELGTYKMAAHPFLTPAIEGISSEFMSPKTWSPIFL